MQFSLEDKLSNLSILVDSDFNLAEKHAIGEVSFRKVFKKHPNGPMFQTETFGKWTQQEGFVKYNNELSILRGRKSLGISLNACIVITHNDSLNHLTDRR